MNTDKLSEKRLRYLMRAGGYKQRKSRMKKKLDKSRNELFFYQMESMVGMYDEIIKYGSERIEVLCQ